MKKCKSCGHYISKGPKSEGVRIESDKPFSTVCTKCLSIFTPINKDYYIDGSKMKRV